MIVLKSGDQLTALCFDSVDFWVRILDFLFGWASPIVGMAMCKARRPVHEVKVNGTTLSMCELLWMSRSLCVNIFLWLVRTILLWFLL